MVFRDGQEVWNWASVNLMCSQSTLDWPRIESSPLLPPSFPFLKMTISAYTFFCPLTSHVYVVMESLGNDDDVYTYMMDLGEYSGMETVPSNIAAPQETSNLWSVGAGWAVATAYKSNLDALSVK